MTAQTAARTPAVARIRETPLLRWTLELDGVANVVTGLVYVLAAGWISDQLGLPTALLYPTGAFMIAAGAVIFAMSSRRSVPALWVGAVIVLNFVWAVDSVVVAAAGWFDPTTAGTVWILLQAGVVAVLGAFEWAGLRRARS
jgi:hypothetical protein